MIAEHIFKREVSDASLIIYFYLIPCSLSVRGADRAVRCCEECPHTI